MKNRLMGSIFWFVVLACSTVVRAQTSGAQAVPRTPDGKPDLSGIWKAVSSRAEPMELTDWGKDRFDYNKSPKGNVGRAELDPLMHCYRPGLARLGPPLQVPAKSIRVRFEGESVPLPGGPAEFDVIEIRYAPRKVWVMYQFNQEVRQIFTDGREHPEWVEYDLLSRWWNGHSVGSWDGDTFVVDTTNIRDEVWIDNLGHEQRDLHIEDRFRRVDAENLEIERTLTDPIALAEPFTTRVNLKLRMDVDLDDNMTGRQYDCSQFMVRKPAFNEGENTLLGISEPTTGEY